MYFKLWILMWDVFGIGRFLWPWMLLPPSFPAPFLLPSVFPSLSVITVSVSFSLYAHAMEDRVQCWVSFINHSPPGSLKEPLIVPEFAGIIITRAPPLFIPSALGLRVCTRDLNSDPYVIYQALHWLNRCPDPGGHILWLSSLVYLFCISVVDNSLPYLYFYLICSLLWQIKPSKKTWQGMCILFYFSFLSCFMITEIMTRFLVFKYQHKILLTVNFFSCFEIII